MTFMRKYWVNKIYDTLNTCPDHDKEVLKYNIESIKQSMNIIKYIISKNKQN